MQRNCDIFGPHDNKNKSQTQQRRYKLENIYSIIHFVTSKAKNKKKIWKGVGWNIDKEY